MRLLAYPATIIPNMDNTEKQIEAIQEEMRKTPYHKGTQKWFGKMRAKIARLRDQILWRPFLARQGGGGFSVRKFGDSSVVLVGLPSVGKSTLLNALTNAKSPTAEYAFTTIPGMMNFNGAQIQILDVPGLIEGASRGAGRGREVLSVVRGADLLLIIGERGKEENQFMQIDRELLTNGVRINQEPPEVAVKKLLRGGIKINSTFKQEIDRETIREVAKEFGIINAEITIREKLTLDRLIDVFATSRVYVPALYVINKVDKLNFGGTPEVRVQFHFGSEAGTTPREVVRISAERGLGLESLREKMWEVLGLVRVYLRDPRGHPRSHSVFGGRLDLEQVIVHTEETLGGVLGKLGPDASIGKTEARIWGPGARFPGQIVSLGTKVQDRMEVTFV